MKKTLLIVESPTKAKTISKYLGRNYSVMSSMGHIVDLPKSRIAVDIENNFEPDLITVRGAGSRLSELKKQASKSKEVLLASDHDREGEAIAWNIQNAILKSHPDVKFKRIIFNEITKNAIKESLKKPQIIDIHKVNAQKARRVLDRIVGYNLSPLLWEKVKKGLSAGRVQSVSLKLLCDRDEEIKSFIPKEYWHLDILLKKGKSLFKARFHSYKSKKKELETKDDIEKIIKICSNGSFIVKDIIVKNRIRNPLAPFITSKLQQEASTTLNFAPDKTMRIAQSLYEGIDIKRDRIGLITYMRTDSVRISDNALTSVRNYIKNNFGEKYLPSKVKQYNNKKRVQDAHEAIRPTNIELTPKNIASFLSPEQLKLYNLIWNRFVASQMQSAIYQQMNVEIDSNDVLFKVVSSKLVFDGFLILFPKQAKEEDISIKLPKLKIGDNLKNDKFIPEQHFTEAPPKYTEASLVKKLEEAEIGRPSTYAPTITTLVKRYYVSRNKKQLVPTELGILTNKLIHEFFPDITNVKFTANLESLLDKVEEEKMDWVKILKDFYGNFSNSVVKAKKEMINVKANFDEVTDEICEKCGRAMVKKLGKYGYFLACPGFPECKNSKPISLGKCPIGTCGGVIITKKAKRRQFYGCSKYPKCDFVSWDAPSKYNCPKCSNITFYQFIKSKGRYIICKNPKCLHQEREKKLK